MSALRITLRALTKRPAPTLVIVVTLAVVIGATTIIYSVIDGVWHSIPVSNSERVVFVASTDPRPSQSQSGMRGNLALAGVSIPDLVDWTERSRTIEQFAGFRMGTATLTGMGAPDRVDILRVTANLPSMWGVTPALGVNFRPADGRPGAEPVAMLSYRFWEQQFSSSPSVIGRSLLLDGTPHTVVGVLPQRTGQGIFRDAELMVAQPLDAARSLRDERRMFMTARLKDGVTREQAAADLEEIASRLKAEYPLTNGQTGVVVRPLVELVGGENPFLLFLLALIAMLVIVMACANVSNVILAQIAARHREISLRSALGASRFDHVRQVMAESFVVSAVAGVVGLLLAWSGMNALRWLAGQQGAPFLGDSGLSGRVLVASVLTSTIVPFGFALFPALRSSKPDPMELREGGRAAGGHGGRMRSALVALQVGLAMILMVQIGIVARAALRFQMIENGFDAAKLVTFRINLNETRYASLTRATQFYDALLGRISTLPGVSAAAAVNRLPIADRELGVRLAVEGRAPVAPEALPSAALSSVTPGYLGTMGIPLLRGRGFAATDLSDAPPVALVSEEAGRSFWPGGDPIGKRITLKTPPVPETPLLVVGVVGNIRNSDIDRRVMPQVYVPASWYPDRAMAIVVRTETSDPLQLVPAIRQQAAQLEPSEPLFGIQSMEQVLFDDLSGTNTLTALLSAIGLVAMCLAAAGIFGVVSYSVTHRRREIGVRMALGAKPGTVQRMVVGQGSIPIAAGGLAGLVVAVLLARVMSSALSVVDAAAPLVYSTVVLSIAFVALMACYVPARRAARVDPIEALRAE